MGARVAVQNNSKNNTLLVLFNKVKGGGSFIIWVYDVSEK